MKGLYLSALIISVFCTKTSHALTKTDVIEITLKDAPQVKMLKAEVDASRGDITQSLGAFDLRLRGDAFEYQGYYDYNSMNLRLEQPISVLGLDIYAGFRRGQGNIPIYEQKQWTLDRGEWSVGFSVPLLQNLVTDSRRFNLFKARNVLLQSELRYEQGVLEQLRNSLFRYFDWSVATARLEVNKDLFKRAVERGEWLEARVKHGDMARFELEDNRRSILQRDALVKNSEFLIEQAKRDLALQLGIEEGRLDSKPTIDLEIPKETDAVEDLIRLGNKNRKDIEAAANQIQVLDEDIRLGKNQRLPKLDLKAQADRDEGDGDYTLKGNRGFVGVSLEFPIWQRNARGRVETATAQKMRAEVNLRLLRNKLDFDIRNSKVGLDTATQRFQISQEEFKLAQKLEEGERSRFKKGDSSILTVNLREQATAEARLRMYEAWAEAHRNFISLRVLTGRSPRF